MIDGLTDEIFTVFGEGMGLLKEFGFRKIDFEFWVEGEENLVDGGEETGIFIGRNEGFGGRGRWKGEEEGEVELLGLAAFSRLCLLMVGETLSEEVGAGFEFLVVGIW